MKLNLNHNQDIQPIGTSEPVKCSLLIPRLHLAYFNSRCEFYKCRKNYLKMLIEKNLPLSTQFVSRLKDAKNPQWNTHYQAEKLGLQKRNFVPVPEDWERLRHVAGAFGVSLCFLFVFLMELEMDGNLQPHHDTPPSGRNSSPDMENSDNYSIKFSILIRKVDLQARRLIRQYQTG